MRSTFKLSLLHLTAYIFIFCLLSACQNKKPTETTVVKTGTTVSERATIKSDYDTLIPTPCAVLIDPTLAKIDSMKNKIGEDDFYVAADDYVNYMGEAGFLFDSLKTKQINKESKGIIAFKTYAGQIFTINLDKYTWAILLFNGKNKPFEADMTMLEENYDAYMK